MVGSVVEEAHEHLYVLEGGCGITAPTADIFARGGVVLKDDGIVALEFNAVTVAAIVCAIVCALYGEQLPTVSDGAVLESGCVLRGESVIHKIAFLLRLRPLRNLLMIIIHL